MISYTKTRRVDRSAETAFDIIATHVFENHPKWEAEVLEIRRLDQGAVGVGSRAVMVRSEGGTDQRERIRDHRVRSELSGRVRSSRFRNGVLLDEHDRPGDGDLLRRHHTCNDATSRVGSAAHTAAPPGYASTGRSAHRRAGSGDRRLSHVDLESD